MNLLYLHKNLLPAGMPILLKQHKLFWYPGNRLGLSFIDTDFKSMLLSYS